MCCEVEEVRKLRWELIQENSVMDLNKSDVLTPESMKDVRDLEVKMDREASAEQIVEWSKEADRLSVVCHRWEAQTHAMCEAVVGKQRKGISMGSGGAA